ncbi:MAG: 4-alpha-glucanotransferase [Selenomonadaceae bacterium]|nr:4-alpha-glucanotransferase [Selenomonadaceae bacterium]
MIEKNKVFHNTRNLYYRSKIGAARAGDKISLALMIFDRSEKHRNVCIRLWVVGEGERIVKTVKTLPDNGSERYSAEIELPKEGTLVWYYFIIEDEGKIYYYGNNKEKLGGVGELVEDNPESFQITVYEEQNSPDWMKNAIYYQIFPDRFYRSKVKLVNKKRAVFHADFENPPLGDRANGLEEFYGGDLAGIYEKLEYLKELGINAIHLTPITLGNTSHRYDILDHMTVDDALGVEEDFKKLTKKAEELGIKIILEGVFSYVSADSRYFNKGKLFDEEGAYQSRKSKYNPWFEFWDFPHKYEARWGDEKTPKIRERNEGFQDFVINGKDSVLNHWLNMGAAGFRLNAPGDLSSAFTEKFYQAANKKGAAVIGEVWDDASNKVAYDTPRTYLSGREMDGATGYPFRANVIDFIMNHIDGKTLFQKLSSYHENYPKQAQYLAMNLLGSHDTERIGKVFGEGETAVKRQKMAALWQFTYVGAPSIYYADEAGAKDSRAPFPWGHENVELLDFYKKCVDLRKNHPVLERGEIIPLFGEGDVFAFARIIRNNKDAFNRAADNETFVIALNRSNEERIVYIDTFDFTAGTFADEFTGEQFSVVRGKLKLVIKPLSFLALKELALKPKYKRKAGVLLHPTSLPSPYGTGDFGKSAFKFIDMLSRAKQSVWQILPMGPVDFFGFSPYQSPSAFAGNPLLIDLEDLVERNLLTKKDIATKNATEKNVADFEKAWLFKREALKKAYAAFKRPYPEDYSEFIERQAYWLDDFSLFTALKEYYRGEAWTKWPKEVRTRQKSSLAKLKTKLADEIGFVKFQQYLFDAQWKKVHEYANEKGVEILGDMPIFVSHDSADCWANQHLFDLDEDGAPNTVAGVPPDYFSATGQLWGNPQYDWTAMKDENYAWWKNRFQKLYETVDIVRIDHFRGFEAYWEVIGSAKTAINGKWVKGPGKPFFDAIRIALGKLPIVAEDLGIITDEVETLRAACDFPGMQVLHFAINFAGDNRYGFVPSENSIVYTGTHDNNTTRGWYERELSDEYKLALSNLLGADMKNSEEMSKKLVEFAYRSSGRMAIIPLQDLLFLDSKHRMNIPGTVGMNWKWRATTKDLEAVDTKWLKNLTEETNRV